MTKKPGIIVAKFGGTSIGTPEAIRQATEVVRQTALEWEQQVVVVSAMAGVTNRLIESAWKASQGDGETFNRVANELRQRHKVAADTLIANRQSRDMLNAELEKLFDEFTSLCHAICVLGEATPRAMDAVVSLGERLSVRVVAGAFVDSGLNARFVESTDLIVTDDCFQDAHPDFSETRVKVENVICPLLEGGVIPVVTGFLGATKEGITSTLGRGGSDYSAAIIGAVLPAEEVWIWTDVDGVMTADPRLVAEARTIPELSYLEVAELAYFGAKVLHPKTIRPVIEAGIDLRVCNTFSPGNLGTRVISNKTKPTKGEIKAVTAIRGQKLITIEGRGMLGVPGVAARAFGAVAATGTSVILISQASSEQSICFSVPAESVPGVIKALAGAFATELVNRDIDRIWATEETVIITVVGAGLQHTPGIAGRIFTALGEQGVNVIAIAQGSSEVAISMIVDRHDTEDAVRALHALI
jgi:aspartate kinase